ncbi:MAG: lipoyl synthase [Oscillospiraceae bacterium]|nr:lipoyl synthase [Oscillospiraceae bacterium]
MTDQKKPSWLRVKYNKSEVSEISEMMSALGLNTVCKEAECPNMGECFKKRTATFMILGKYCTRDCRFCSVEHGAPESVCPEEPEHIAEAAVKLGLRHVVITSVTRDDLPDGGAEQFAACVRSIKRRLPSVAVELLIPDFKGSNNALDIVIAAHPDVIGHNVETVPSLYSDVRPQAVYTRSLEVLKYIKSKSPDIRVKSGIMVGLGEKKEEVFTLFDDLRAAGCDIITIGQYLRPSVSHVEMKEYITPEMFEMYKTQAQSRGFGYVSCGPLVRSSYHAAEALRETDVHS